MPEPKDIALRQKQRIRRRRFANASALALADVATLVTALGGDAAVSAIYDIRVGITATAGKITQWDDARGNSGFGPSLVPFSTSPGPNYDSVGLTATFVSATSGTLASASTFAAFDPSAARSIVYVGTAAQTFICGIGTTAQNINLGGEGLTDFLAGVNGTVRSVDSGVTNSTRRVVFAKMVAGAITVEAPTHVLVTGTAGAPTSVSGNVTLGGASPVVAGGGGVVRAFLVLSSAYSNAQRDTIDTWAVASHAAVLA